MLNKTSWFIGDMRYYTVLSKKGNQQVKKWTLNYNILSFLLKYINNTAYHTKFCGLD